MLERTIKKAVKKRLEELGCYQFWPVQRGLGAATLDILICHKGRFYAIETKAPGAKLTMRQKFVFEEMEAAGAVVFIIDNLEQAKTFTLP